jgi:hypothetical protein
MARGGSTMYEIFCMFVYAFECKLKIWSLVRTGVDSPTNEGIGGGGDGEDSGSSGGDEAIGVPSSDAAVI